MLNDLQLLHEVCMLSALSFSDQNILLTALQPTKYFHTLLCASRTDIPQCPAPLLLSLEFWMGVT